MKAKETNYPLVSIIIPLYNQKRYFPACIRSVKRQTYKNIEVIVVNDGSTDNSLQIALDWAASDLRVKIINKKNEGTAFARRDGYLAATGEYITFVDSDDCLTKTAIETMTQCAIQKRVDIVMGKYDHFLWRIITHHKVDDSSSFPCGQVMSQPELFNKYYLNFFRSGSMFPINVW